MSDTTEIVKKDDQHFFILSNNNGRWDWVLFAANGTYLARSGKSYTQKKDCLRMLRKLFGLNK